MSTTLVRTIAILSLYVRLTIACLAESIRSAAGLAAHGLQQLYNGNVTGVLGKFPYPPYYWWESGGPIPSPQLL